MKTKKIITLSILFSVLIFPEIINATECIVCGNNKEFPVVIATIVSTFITIVKIFVPILLIISGMIAFMKATFSSNVEEDLKKAKTKLINSIIAAVIIFFIISIVNFAIGLIAGKNNQFMKCINCFVNPDKCEKRNCDMETIKPGFIEE